MDALLKKRNDGQGPVVVLAAPEEFRSTLQAWSAEAPVSDVMTGGAGHILCFARQEPEVEPLVTLAAEPGSLSLEPSAGARERLVCPATEEG